MLISAIVSAPRSLSATCLVLNFVPHITQKRLCVLGGDAQRKAHGGLDVGGSARATRFLAVCSRPVAFAPQSWASRFPAGFCVTADPVWSKYPHDVAARGPLRSMCWRLS